MKPQGEEELYVSGPALASDERPPDSQYAGALAANQLTGNNRASS